MPSLRPARALLHPAWLASLAVLVLNDHVLKRGHVLPGWMTGKLSDLAGLFLAPVLLALVLRVRSRRGLALAHGLVGLVFALVKVWPPATHAFEALLSHIVRSRAWTDPTDLVALPMLALAWRTLLPWMERDDRAHTVRAAQIAAAMVGAVACVATSKAVEPATLKNATGAPVTVQIARLDAQVRLGGNARGGATATLREDLPYVRALFEEGRTVTLKDGEQIELDETSFTAFVLADGSGFATNVQGEAALVLSRGTKGLQLESSEPVAAIARGNLPTCSRPAQLEVGGLPMGVGTSARIRSVIDLGQGCRQVDFDGATSSWRYCSPPEGWPFAVGDTVTHTREGLVRAGSPATALLFGAVGGPLREDTPLCVSVDACGSVTVESVGSLLDAPVRSGDVGPFTDAQGVTRTAIVGAVRTMPIRNERCTPSSPSATMVLVDTDYRGPVPDAGARDGGAD